MSGAHFYHRCRERGISSVNPNQLRHEIERAVAQGRDDLVHFVCRTPCKSHRVFRFTLPVEGNFYVLISDAGRAVTVPTQEMIRGYKAVRRGEARSIQDAQIAQMEKESWKHSKQRRIRLRRKK